MIAGLLEPTSGRVLFDGAPVEGVPAHRRNVAMVFQKPLLFPYLTIGENVAFGLKMRGTAPADRDARVREMLELVRLPGFESRRPKQLSGGQEQRVSLARALVIQPRVLLLDEPLSQLDANLRIEMRDLILRVQRTLGITMIFVTHDQEEAVMLADRVALIFEGVLQQYDTPRGFYERPKDERVARFFGGQNFLPGRKRGRVIETSVGAFEVAAPSDLPDGPATLTIRPEAVALTRPARAAAADPAGAAANAAAGRVRASLYLGTHIRYTIALGDHEVVAIADAGAGMNPGDEVTVTMPSEKLWLLPSGGAA
jgi:ABC-type Fe3+/spermidine/putrescine transport system ATPase subunit